MSPQTENGGVSNGTGERSIRGARGGGAEKVNETLQSTVFNCALNPALKKKKIPRVIPPPPNQVRCIVIKCHQFRFS